MTETNPTPATIAPDEGDADEYRYTYTDMIEAPSTRGPFPVHTYDTVIVGAGGAGMRAALEAGTRSRTARSCGSAPLTGDRSRLAGSTR